MDKIYYKLITWSSGQWRNNFLLFFLKKKITIAMKKKKKINWPNVSIFYFQKFELR